jgi:hypothetical protein
LVSKQGGEQMKLVDVFDNSTQAKRLAKKLKKRGHVVRITQRGLPPGIEGSDNFNVWTKKKQRKKKRKR